MLKRIPVLSDRLSGEKRRRLLSRQDQEDRAFAVFIAGVSALALTAALLLAMVIPAVSAGPGEEIKDGVTGTILERPSEASGWELYRRGLYPEAIEEWTQAVDQKQDAGAAFKIAEEYFDAKVVERDMAIVIKYLTIGAEGGDARAQMDLGTLFDNGWGVPKSPEMAAKLFMASAQQGMLEAQYNIATMFELGQGVERDLEQAYMFYLLAVEGGFPTFAQQGLENTSRMMSPQQIKNATLNARKFEPEKTSVLVNDDNG